MDYREYRDEVREYTREARWTLAKIFFSIILPIMVLCGVGGLLVHFVMKPVEVLDKVTDPDRMISNYEWFIQQDKDIKAVDIQIVNATKARDDFRANAGDRSKWTFDDRQEDSRLSSVATGLMQQRASMVADYNAKTDMGTRSFLKQHNLPDHYE